jgi:hypothetical protein
MSIGDFSFLMLFRISIHHSRPSILKEVLWNPPLLNWYKCNIDGASCAILVMHHVVEFLEIMMLNLYMVLLNH